jgi:hypothetical protein
MPHQRSVGCGMMSRVADGIIWRYGSVDEGFDSQRLLDTSSLLVALAR